MTAIGVDLVRGTKTLDVIKSVGFPQGKFFFAGVIDGRNIWANDLSSSLSTLEGLESIVRKGIQIIILLLLVVSNSLTGSCIVPDKLVVSTSCSLLHTAVDLLNETKLDGEIKSWLAFAAQKIVEVNALAKALAGQQDRVSQFSNRILPIFSLQILPSCWSCI